MSDRPAGPPVGGWVIRLAAVCLLLGTPSCVRLPERVVRRHPPLATERPQARVVERSAPVRPAWAAGDLSGLTFVGSASAPDREQAEAAAIDDLREAVARYFLVEIASDEGARMEASEEGERQQVRIDRRAFAGARADAVNADATYWERLVVPGEAAAQYRFFARARLEPADLAQVKAAGAVARAKKAGRRVVVVAAVGGPRSAAVAEDLALRLAIDPRFMVIEPALAEALGADRTRTLGDLRIEIRPGFELALIDGDRTRLFAVGDQSGDLLALEDRAAELVLGALQPLEASR